MVRALLAGTKTQTRRVLKGTGLLDLGMRVTERGVPVSTDDWGVLHYRPLPFAAGDRLWVREAWRTFVSLESTRPADLYRPGERGAGVAYEADRSGMAITKQGGVTFGPREMDTGAFGKLRPGIHMPRWASRLTLHITEARVQRLQEISEEDAIDEGILPLPSGAYFDYVDTGYVPGIGPPPYDAKGSYATLWASINGVESWAANPWVVAVSFLVEKANIERASRAE